MSQQPQTNNVLNFIWQLNESEPGLGLLLGLFAIVAVLALLFFWARLVTEFSTELRLLNMEIRRSEGREREHYLRRRRRLWLSLIPFVRY